MHANPMEQERLEETFKGRGSHNLPPLMPDEDKNFAGAIVWT